MSKITSESILAQWFDGSIPSSDEDKILNYGELVDTYYDEYLDLTWSDFMANFVEFISPTRFKVKETL